MFIGSVQACQNNSLDKEAKGGVALVVIRSFYLFRDAELQFESKWEINYLFEYIFKLNGSKYKFPTQTFYYWFQIHSIQV